MKSAFAACLVAAVANGKTPFQKFKDLFELNEDGRWQLKQMPDLPKLSWENVDPAEIESWFQGK